MRKLYEEPIFEVNKFSFESILADDYVKDSNPEGTLGEGGESSAISSNPWGDDE